MDWKWQEPVQWGFRLVVLGMARCCTGWRGDLCVHSWADHHIYVLVWKSPEISVNLISSSLKERFLATCIPLWLSSAGPFPTALSPRQWVLHPEQLGYQVKGGAEHFRSVLPLDLRGPDLQGISDINKKSRLHPRQAGRAAVLLTALICCFSSAPASLGDWSQ